MDQKFIEKAKTELREDENRKSQSLAQFREWIAKHPFLSKVNSDDSNLLKFLRVRKYNMDEACQLFERFHLANKRYPHIFDFTTKDEDKVQELIKMGYCVPLQGRNEKGEKVMVFRPGVCDPEIFTPYDGVRVLYHIGGYLLEEEETQISGFSYILDCNDLKLKHMMTPMELKELANLTKNLSGVRIKSVYIVNLPSFANTLMEIFKKFLTEKLRNRIFLVKNYDDLKNHFDADLLPKEYGGTVPIQAMLDSFYEYEKSRVNYIKTVFSADVDWSKVPEDRIHGEGDEAVGSFRKLEID